MKFPKFNKVSEARAIKPSAALERAAKTDTALDILILMKEELDLGRQGSVIRLVNLIVEAAQKMRASDVHMDPQGTGIKIRFRIDGVLQEVCDIPKASHDEIISRIKILSGLRTDEHQAAQDGRFRAELSQGQKVDIRVSIVPTYFGENAVLRLLSDKAEDFSLESLGFTKENQERILSAIGKPYGMILATGPTGSGKTTTLYTLVKMLNTPEVSIITIEDPIEYAIFDINQIQVNSRTELTFANGLRSMLRQDPNIIMVGEIRDQDTAGLAVNTALTGHLVLSTLHTNDAPTTLPRLLDMKVEPYLIASTVNIAIGQRLVRRICDECKEPLKLTPAAAKSLMEIVQPAVFAKYKNFYIGVGCEACNHTGYKGRVGIHEVMIMDTVLREAILKRVPSAQLRKLAIEQGMISMVEDGFTKAGNGLTTIEEVLRMLHE